MLSFVTCLYGGCLVPSPCLPSSNHVLLFIAHETTQVRSLKGLKFVHLNARSLLAHWEEISAEFLTRDFEVVVVTETWLHSLVSDSLISKEGYHLIRLDRHTLNQHGYAKQGGGICVYVRDDFNVDRSNCFVSSNADYELLHLKLTKGFHKRINLIGVYRPPSGSYKSCVDELDRICTEIPTRNDGNLMILGDFNIDLNEPNHPASKYLLEFAENNNHNTLNIPPVSHNRGNRNLI